MSYSTDLWCCISFLRKTYKTKEDVQEDLEEVNEKRIQQAKQSGISKTQVYKMAGNSIVVHQLHAIFEQMFYPIPQRGEQLTLFQ